MRLGIWAPLPHTISREPQIDAALTDLTTPGQEQRIDRFYQFVLVAAKALGAGLMGPPQVIADRIRRYEDIGMTCLMLQFHPMKQGLERFANDIMPLLR